MLAQQEAIEKKEFREITPVYRMIVCVEGKVPQLK